MELYPDPEYDGEKAWLFFVANLCIKGKLFHFDLVGDLRKDLIAFSYLELHTDTVFCIACNKKLGSLPEDVYNPPVVCYACRELQFNVTTGLIEIGKLLGFKNPRKAYCYLLEYNLNLRKGICRNFKNV